ncbi:MAG: sulfite oxidase-like oxidoreductase [Nitrososphaerota archaeon]|nr:sulfite oxidase-like oxidoreductase [Nitrososphaerota archaeon]MDG6939335.1 sulfite oxidase-like oxidoreductase [Nitrososphaerota archaeon]
MPEEAQKEVPPGQRYVKRFIYYACLGVPDVDVQGYRLRVFGNVGREVSLPYEKLLSGPLSTVEKDFHCVTGWSVAGTRWEGVRLGELIGEAAPLPGSEWVMFHSLDGYTTPVPLRDALAPDSIVAVRLNGAPLSREMGYPARPIIPALYGWKSAKWLAGVEVLEGYRDGFWEERGYNEVGNVWKEERFKEWGGHLRRSPISG